MEGTNAEGDAILVETTGKGKGKASLKQITGGTGWRRRDTRARRRKTATIGHIGKKVVFETSDRKILTFSKMQRTVKGRWASHSRVGKKPKKQFLGPDADRITFTITLNAEHGVKPRRTAENIEKLIRTGKPQTVVIGKKKVGSNKYAITEMSEDWETVMNRGEVLRITCDITLEEYL